MKTLQRKLQESYGLKQQQGQQLPGTGIPGCVLILNRNKPDERKNKLIFIYAAKDYQGGKVRNKIRDSDIGKIVSAFNSYKDMEKYCHTAEMSELKENDFNLKVPRYVDTSESEDEIDIQKRIDTLKEINREREKIEANVQKDLRELGFVV